MDIQKEFWEDKKVLKRRSPVHPAIEAYAVPKIREMLNVFENNGFVVNKEAKSLLDVGSGNGYFSYYLERYFDVTCLDFSRNILKVCSLRNKIQASANMMPFRNNSFDVVFCANLLHHMEDPVKACHEMLRISSRYVVIMEPNRWNPAMFLISFISKTDKAVRKFSKKYMCWLASSLNKVSLVYLKQTGIVLPNITPVILLPIIKKMERVLFPKMFYLMILEKKEDTD